ncbi:MAG: transposase [Rhodobacteraceae bacterium]|nr:transposase [Paracoccaceae bacterium]
MDVEAAEAALTEVEDRDPVTKYPAPSPNWRRAWTEGIPFLDDPPEGRKRIHTATAIEAQTSKPRRAVRTRGHFPSDGAAAKSIYLAQTATSREWARPVRQWQAVKASGPSCSKTASQWHRRSASAQNAGQYQCGDAA